MQIDWTLISFVTLAFFAINGFFRGWWKEAINTAVIVFFLMLLQRPELAETTVNLINQVMSTSWNLLNRLLGSFVTLPADVPQLDPTVSITWVILLVILLGVAGILARIFLPGSTNRIPGQFYRLGLVARFLGLGLGAMNGFLALGLLREYLDGRALPGQVDNAAAAVQSAGSITVVNGSSYAEPAGRIAVELVGLPDFTILDSAIPFALVGVGGLLALVALYARISIASSADGYKIQRKAPYGYEALQIEKPKPKGGGGG